MISSRRTLYPAALIGLLLFGALVLFDMLRPGTLLRELSLAVSLGLAVCGVGVLVLRPRAKRLKPHETPPQDFTAILEERRRLAEEAARRHRTMGDS